MVPSTHDSVGAGDTVLMVEDGALESELTMVRLGLMLAGVLELMNEFVPIKLELAPVDGVELGAEASEIGPPGFIEMGLEVPALGLRTPEPVVLEVGEMELERVEAAAPSPLEVEIEDASPDDRDVLDVAKDTVLPDSEEDDVTKEPPLETGEAAVPEKVPDTLLEEADALRLGRVIDDGTGRD